MNIFISPNESILSALELLEANKRRFLLVVDGQNYVKGVLVDGDIRRALINGRNTKENISSIYQYNYKKLLISDTFETICELFQHEGVDFLPILDKKDKYVNFITKEQFHFALLQEIEFDLNYDFYKLNTENLAHEIYNRPWGFYKSMLLTNTAQNKIITLFPNEELSLQEHRYREEHWIIMKGTGQVILDKSIINVEPGKYIFIPKGCKHKAINTSNVDNLVFTETQLGSYFGEDDIIRYSDKYGRK